MASGTAAAAGIATGVASVAVAILVFLTNWFWRQQQQRREKEARLAELKKQYSEAVQPAAAHLDALRQLYPAGRLWPVLLNLAAAVAPGVAAAGAARGAAAAVTPQGLPDYQLLDARIKFFAAEQQARNAVKGFWERLAGAMERRELPKTFGTAAPGGRVDFRGAEGGTWAARAGNFRLLVEPFDVANYYRLALDLQSGHYLDDDNRPRIYGRLEVAAEAYHCQKGDQSWRRGIAWARHAQLRLPAAGSATEVPAGLDPVVDEAFAVVQADPAKRRDTLDGAV